MIIFVILFSFASGDQFIDPNLPDDHLDYYFKNFPEAAKQCQHDSNCNYLEQLESNKCWGYEKDCLLKNQFSIPKCPGEHKGWVQSKYDQQNTFYFQGDFGYVKEQLKELKVLCEPLYIDDSSLECTDYLRFCRGRNIMINFTSLSNRKEPLRYKMDVLSEGDIGGYCNLQKSDLMKQLEHVSPLQSWAPEMRYFRSLKRRPIVDGDCDVVIEKPTFILKIDATVNMYHHFCDFFNLYISLHLNSSHPTAFSTDVHILIWESYSYHSAFADTFQAFTDHEIWDLKTVQGKNVCFRNVVFPLLPRMIFGLYYNTPIIRGCEGSGMFKAFSEHILHRLKIPFHARKSDKIRITFLSRNTKYRIIVNEKELIDALTKNKGYEVRRVAYGPDMGFKEQLEITRNTDIFIGMHGAGLTHLLFLPDWAAVFEVYNCEDTNCYLDLARLRGLKYVTWKNIGKIRTYSGELRDGEAHAKFANYAFDTTEFLKLVEDAAQHVKGHPKFNEIIANLTHDEL